jgi:hypothetical protein
MLGLRLAILCSGLIFLVGCAETVVIQTIPPGATVRVNDVLIGTSPVLFSAHSKEVERTTYHYQVEEKGYLPAEGDLQKRIAPGRIVAYVFTLGIFRAFRGVKAFVDPAHIKLQPVGAAAHAATSKLEARLNELKSLRDRGVISEEEYRQARAAALKGL